MANSKDVLSLWHPNCAECDFWLQNAECRCEGDLIGLAISSLHGVALRSLKLAVARLFCMDGQERYESILARVDKHIRSKDFVGDTDKVSLAVKLLQKQHYFLARYGAFNNGDMVLISSVEMLERVLASMKTIAIALGLNSCADDIGALLYDPSGPEQQVLNGSTVLVNQQNSTTIEHDRMSKLALKIAHTPPPGSKKLRHSELPIYDYREHFPIPDAQYSVSSRRLAMKMCGIDDANDV